MKKNVFLMLVLATLQLSAQKDPMSIGVAGLTHGHVNWVFGAQKSGDIKIVGIVEPNTDLAKRYIERYGLTMDLVFDNMEEMLTKKKPVAVTAFGSIYEHLAVVEACAPKGIHVMVEKPLAVSVAHANKMEALAKKHKIHLLTNYETTWYPTNHKAYEIMKKGDIGGIRKVIVRDGHKGPKKIGVQKEFLDWLTDPVQNGGGALIDFGCYGANLLTWLHEGKRPNTVTAVTQQLQVENNPKVDDDCTILLTYDNSMAILEPSWNWPIGRKDMEIYGEKGVVYADNRHDMRIRISEGYDGFSEEKFKLEEREAPFDDPFRLFIAVIRGEIELNPSDLSSLENNMIVVEILEAARESAKTGKSIELK